MKLPVYLPLPALKALRTLGKDISAARRRRRIPLQLMAERAGLSRATISKIEKGDPTASIGGYAAVLWVLGMVERLSSLADLVHDLTGRQLEEETLPQRIRMPRTKKRNSDE